MSDEISTDICTIYLLTNIKNGKVYVGQTWMSCEERMGKNGSGYANSPYIYNAIQRDGAESFQYTILEMCNDQATADRLEEEYMVKYNSRNHEIGYNIKQGGSAGRHSEETKKKISESLMGREVSEETRQKISAIHLGVPKPPHTQEWKDNNSEFMIERHKTDGHPMQGKHHTEEAKQKIGEANKGKIKPREGVERGAEKRKMNKERELAIVQAYIDGNVITDIIERFSTSQSSIYIEY